jgi:hypothetical protein
LNTCETYPVGALSTHVEIHLHVLRNGVHVDAALAQLLVADEVAERLDEGGFDGVLAKRRVLIVASAHGVGREVVTLAKSRASLRVVEGRSAGALGVKSGSGVTKGCASPLAVDRDAFAGGLEDVSKGYTTRQCLFGLTRALVVARGALKLRLARMVRSSRTAKPLMEKAMVEVLDRCWLRFGLERKWLMLVCEEEEEGGGGGGRGGGGL